MQIREFGEQFIDGYYPGGNHWFGDQAVKVIRKKKASPPVWKHEGKLIHVITMYFKQMGSHLI
jgi:hypothetical protein